MKPAALRTWVREDFGVDLGALDEIGHGADEAAQLWRATDKNTNRYAVKLSGGGTPAGLVVTDHLARFGVPGIAGPVRTRDGRLWSERDGRRLSLVPWVSDRRALKSDGMTAAHWESYGALLARVHATPVTDELEQVLPREEHIHQKALSLHRRVEGRLNEDDGLAKAMAERWRVIAGQTQMLLDRAHTLGRELRGRPGQGVVCHGDPHLGNLLLGNDGRVWLIDWDDVVLAPPERDLMFVTGGVLAFAPVTGQEQAWFFAGYGPVEIDRTRLAYYMCVRAMEDLFGFAAQVLDVRGSEEAERAWALEIVDGLLSPNGLVTLALAALRDLGVALPRPGGRGPGYGTRHPGLAALLDSLTPAAAERIVWPGQVTVDVATYLAPMVELPPELVTSVRCIVRVGDRIVVCQSPDMRHIVPGGRRMPGETYQATACREVYEETGWLIDEADLRPLGFMHFRYADPQPADHPYPHPDFLQPVYTAPAKNREGTGGEWADIDGWERGHRLYAPSELDSLGIPTVQLAFVSALPR